MNSIIFDDLTSLWSVLCSGLLCDLLWSDPDKDVQGWGENDRGVSFTFGADVVSKFLNRHDLDLICRAHQVTAKFKNPSYLAVKATLHCVMKGKCVCT